MHGRKGPYKDKILGEVNMCIQDCDLQALPHWANRPLDSLRVFEKASLFATASATPMLMVHVRSSGQPKGLSMSLQTVGGT